MWFLRPISLFCVAPSEIWSTLLQGLVFDSCISTVDQGITTFNVGQKLVKKLRVESE